MNLPDISGPARLRAEILNDADGLVRIALSGELDGEETQTLSDAVDAAVRHGGDGAVVIDASGLTFLDSGGIRALLIGRKHAARSGRDLVVAEVAEGPYQVLQITGLLEVFGVAGRPVRPVTAGPA